MGRVSGKVALITGGARGLGAAQARSLAAEGAEVVITDVLEEEGRALAGELGDLGEFVSLDVTDRAAWQCAVQRAEERFGPPSVLVNNAGLVHQSPIEDLDEADFRRVIDVNEVGVFLGMQSVLPAMRRAGGGSIVNISSIGGMIAFPGILGYVASKWAVRGMTKAAAQEFGPQGIRVNSVHPGITETEMSAQVTLDELTKNQPLQRPGNPEDIARLVLFLASEESGYCTGSEFVADGGYTSQ